MLFPQTAPGFDHPLGMLQACHARILRQCDTLVRVAQHLRAVGVTDEARDAAHRAHRYFSTSGKHHHEDEEQDLFPALLTVRPELAGTILELRNEHREMEHLWIRIEPSLANIGSVTDFAAFAHDIAEFRAAYISHIERENAKILPAAEVALSAGQISELGKRMAYRRGVSP
ncbi:MAG: hemerythrin domain-containing protein [Gammaproteobacteria bacterium]|nr:hemerythrin domain-containing protein [Gammaproteobacteria bacterium]